MHAPKLIFLIIDVIAIIIISCVVHRYINSNQSQLYYLALCLTTISLFYLTGRYSSKEILKYRYIIGSLLSVLVSLLITYPLLSGTDTNRVLLLSVLFVLILSALLLLAYVFKTTQISIRSFSLVIISSGDRLNKRSEELKDFLGSALKKIRFIDVSELQDGDMNALDLGDESHSAIILYDPKILEDGNIASAFLEQRIRGYKVDDFIRFYSKLLGKIPLDLVSYEWLLTNRSGLYEYPMMIRLIRIIDIIAGIIFSIIFSVPMIIISILIKLESPGPVIFKQERLGQNGVPFVLYKFRSMHIGAESDGPKWASKQDDRASKIGAIIRATHLDELPQVFNLVFGDISLVGPRPIRKHFADILKKEEPLYPIRFLMKPGLTGWAQVKGPYGANIDEQLVKLEMELYYVYASNFLLFIYIIIGTGKKIFSQT